MDPRTIKAITRDLEWNQYVHDHAQNPAQKERTARRIEKFKAELAAATAPQFIDTCTETAYGSSQRLSFQIRVF